MKKIYLLCLVLCTNLCVRAQVTSLTIDNQTPGWLSSKIDYPDQQTVRNLKVTGYINDTDLYFIGSLFVKQSLKVLDLAEANLTGEKNDYWDGKMGGYTANGYILIQKLILPHSLKEIGSLSSLKIDSLIIDTKINKFEKMQSGEYQYLRLGENVDSIMFNAFGYSKIKSLSLPTSLKYIGDLAFHDAEFGDMSFVNNETFLNAEYIGKEAFINKNNSNRENLPDTLKFPKIKQYEISAFDYKEGMHIYWGKDIEQIDYTPNSYDHWNPNFSNAIFHIESITPPATHTYYIWNKEVDVYVPKEAVEGYKAHQGWMYANILPEPRPLQKIVMDSHELYLEKGEQKSILVNLFPDNPDDTNLIWKSENEQVAIVNENGNVIAIAPGTTKIIASSSDKTIADTCVVFVKKHAESVSLSDSSLIFNNVGDCMLLEAIVQPDDATDKSITWKSSNNGVCTVTDKGLVTATGVGTAVITVTTIDGGHTATCVVKVLQHVSSISIDKHSISLKVGDYEQLEVKVTPDNADEKNVVWSSSDEDIASVSETGLVTAYKAGEAWIKVSSVDNPETNDSCKIVVIQPVAGINMSQSSCQLDGIGESVQLEATVLPADATNKEVNWKSSNESVCIVSHGQVVAVGYGTAVIIATTVDGGYMATCTVTVTDMTPVSGVDAEAQGYKVYDLQGRECKRLQKGINIIRFLDGTTKKMMIK